MTRHIIQQSSESPDGRRTAAAALRNVGPILEVLPARLPKTGEVLEVASGTGQHVAAFAEAFPGLKWNPSDVDAGQRQSIASWRQASNLPNIAEPLALDIGAAWPVKTGTMDVVLTINLLHLVPETLAQNFFHQACLSLSDGGHVIVYGPFLRGQDYASDGDRDFDASLRARDPAIGYKSVEAVTDMARACGLTPVAADDMPANNLLLTFVKAS